MFKVTELSMRPASDFKGCFYCGQKVGDDHKKECVLINKKVKVRLIIEYDIEVPAKWDKEDILFNRNMSGFCKSNAIDELQKISEESCLCDKAVFEYIEDSSEAYIKE